MEKTPLCGDCRWNSPSACRNPGRPDVYECSDYLSIQLPAAPTEAKAWAGNQYFDTADSQWKSESPRRSGIPILWIGIIVTVLTILASCAVYMLFLRPRFEAPSSFSATPGNLEIILEWRAVYGSENVRVICQTTDYPAAPDDGLLVYEGSGSSCVHRHLEYGNWDRDTLLEYER